MPVVWNDVAETVRRRTRRIVGVRGIAWLGLVTVLLLWTIGLFDWSLRLNNSWIRLGIAAGLVATLTVTVWRGLIRPFMTRLSDVEVARAIERCHPQWSDRLSSAAQFREAAGDPQLGSYDLQQAVIADVDSRLATIDTQRLFETASTKRLVWLSTGVCVVGIIGAVWQHAAAATVLSRFAMPFADVTWPRTTELQFLDADLHRLDAGSHRTAAGEPFPLYLENRRGPLPEGTTLQLRLADGQTEERALPLTTLRDESGLSHEVGVATLTAHQGPVEFRAVAGDDTDMSWRTLDVMPAPALASVTVTITPPAYAKREQEILDGPGAVEALVGSHVHFVGHANKPLASAWLRREGQPPQEMILSANKEQFTAELTVDKPGHTWFWFDLTDEFGLGPSDAPRYELRGLTDRQPTVFLDEPASDVTVTPDAEVVLRIIARDDLGIASLSLVHSQPNDSPARRTLETSVELPTDENVEFVWNLEALGLTAGDRVTYHAEAVDACDLPRETSPDPSQSSANVFGATGSGGGFQGPTGQVGVSAHRHIDVLSQDEKRQELASRQLKILDSLQELQDRQSQALETTAGLRIQTELADGLSNDDLDLLKQTEIEQQNIRDQLSDPQFGAAKETEALQQELLRNHIDDSQLAQRLDRLSQDFQTLTEDLLPTVEQSLVRARKLSQSTAVDRRSSDRSDRNPANPSDSQHELRQAEQAQSAAVAVMKAAAEDLGNWRRQYEVLSELDDLIVDQKDIHDQTQDVGRETLTQSSDSLSDQQRADLARLSDRQRRLADRLDELVDQGTRPLPEGEASSPTIEAMQDALIQLGEKQTANRMHSAAESLKRNDIVQTAETQQQVLGELRGFGELLHPAEERAAEALLSSVEDQAEEVESLKKRQTQLAQAAQQAMGPKAAPKQDEQLQQLIKEQEQLAQRSEELARQLRRHQNVRSAQSASRAARRMREAQLGIEQNQTQQTADSQQEALDDLQQLADELAQQSRSIEQQLARQQVEQLADELQAAADRQEAIVSATVLLDERHQQRGSWSRSLRKELRDSTDQQQALVDHLEELQASLLEYPVIETSLEHAMEPMQLAIDRMKQTDVGAGTIKQQRTAHRRLLAIVDVTRQSGESQDGRAPSGGPQQTPPSQDGTRQQVPQLLATQLRLLRHLQTDVQTRTVALTERMQDRSDDTEVTAEERDSLARDQTRIADLTQRLLEQFTELPEEHP